MTLLCESENRSGLFTHQEDFIILVPEFLQNYTILIFVLNIENIIIRFLNNMHYFPKRDLIIIQTYKDVI